MSFRIYYPHGGDWAEIALGGSSPSPDPTPTPTPTPFPSTAYVRKTDCDCWKVIAGRCIPLNARVGNRYFFGDGRIKFKSDRYWTKKPGHRHQYSHIYTYAYGNGESGKIFDKFDHVPLLRKENWNPILVTIRSEDYYNKAKADSYDTLWCEKIVLEGKTIYFTYGAAAFLTCDTTSPFFKIIDGHLRNVKKPKMPVFRPNYSWAAMEAKHFVARRLKYRSSGAKETRKWSYASPEKPQHSPISIRRQWKFLSVSGFADLLTQSSVGATSASDKYTKTILLKQVIRRRKSFNPIIVRRHSSAPKGSRGMRYAYFEEVKAMK